MADMSDAADALVALIADVLYPLGAAAPSVTGDRVLVYAGTPDPVTLAGDLAGGTSHVSVFPRPGDKVTSISPDDDDWEAAGEGGSAVLELRRQTRPFQVSIWARDYRQRDALGAVVDAGLAAVTRLGLADGSVAVMTYDGSSQIDDQQQAGIYRRDLVYALNYATTRIMVLTAVATTVTDVTPAVNGVDITMITIVS